MSQLENVTLDALAVSAPARSLPVDLFASEAGLTRAQARMLRRVHGFERVRRDPDTDLFTMVADAGAGAVAQAGDPNAIRYVLYTHTAPTVAPPHVTAADVLRQRLGLPHAEAFAVTQQHCAGGLTTVDVAGQLARVEPATRVLVLVGEKRSTPLARQVAHTTAIGEASAACVVGVGGGRNVVRSYADRTVRLLTEGKWVSPESEQEFNEGYLHHLVAVAREAVARAGIEIDDLSGVVPHNVSRLLWRRTCEALGLQPEQVHLATAADQGHCYCADPFLNLAAMRAAGQLVPGGRYLLTSVGLGTTYAAMVVEH